MFETGHTYPIGFQRQFFVFCLISCQAKSNIRMHFGSVNVLNLLSKLIKFETLQAGTDIHKFLNDFYQRI